MNEFTGQFGTLRNELVLTAWPLDHSVPNCLEMTLKWRLSGLRMFYSLNSERN